jgi:hypothetical protein
MSDLPERQAADLENAMAAKLVTPAWLTDDPCPSWCEGDHPAEEHPEDRSHVAAVHVPVVHTSRSSTDAEAAEYVVVMRRYVGQTDTWVYIGEGEDASRAVQVTVESARRMVAAAAKLVGTTFA